RTPTAARMRVMPPPMFVNSRAVMSWRCVGKLFVIHGPVQLVPPSYEKYRPVLVPATTLLLLFGSTRTFPTAWYCGNCPTGTGSAAPKTLDPTTVQLSPPSVDFRIPWLPIENEP